MFSCQYSTAEEYLRQTVFEMLHTHRNYPGPVSQQIPLSQQIHMELQIFRIV